MVKCIFVDGAISEINLEALNFTQDESIGATAIFEGTIRSDTIGDNEVASIDFTSPIEIAYPIAIDILNSSKKKHLLKSATIYHSIGKIKVGEICFRVEVKASHRKEAFCALPEIVDEFKSKVPVFGKEIFKNNSYVWKENKE